MRTEDFDFELPQELIAQTPLKDRSASRLLVVNRAEGTYEDHHFSDIVDLLRPDDIIVRNNTRVIPARLFGVKEVTGAHVEVLLLRDTGNDVWETLVGNAKVVKPGTVIDFGDGLLKAEFVEYGEAGVRFLKMKYDGILSNEKRTAWPSVFCFRILTGGQASRRRSLSSNADSVSFSSSERAAKAARNFMARSSSTSAARAAPFSVSVRRVARRSARSTVRTM